MAKVVVIGGGPAGLMAAEAAIGNGVEVNLYDAMPSVGRKFLLAGRGGLNLTHSEALESLLTRYGSRRALIEPAIKSFTPVMLQAWVHGLGVDTFVGSSGRIFPRDLKAAPLLRAWLRRLRNAGVRFHINHRWGGWDQDGALCFTTPQGRQTAQADAVVLAVGGGSWPAFGSDAAWVQTLSERHIAIAPLRPANCGFDVPWSEHFRMKFAGHPVKTVEALVRTVEGTVIRQQGEFVITESGVEGGAIYVVSAALRDVIEKDGTATLWIDLIPGRTQPRLAQDLARSRGKRTIATHLKRQAGIDGVKAGLLRELAPQDILTDPARSAAALKSLPLRLIRPRPLDEAISTAGGVVFEELDGDLMLRSFPGIFCSGEMLDWEAPTGGYLLTGCFATGRVAGVAAAEWATRRSSSASKE